LALLNLKYDAMPAGGLVITVIARLVVKLTGDPPFKGTSMKFELGPGPGPGLADEILWHNRSLLDDCPQAGTDQAASVLAGWGTVAKAWLPTTIRDVFGGVLH
jgi:hypothetical protein